MNRNDLAGKKIALTGYGEETDTKLVDRIQEAGGVIEENVHSWSDVLVWNKEIYGETRKLKRAQQFNNVGAHIQIFNVEEFERLLAGQEVVVSETQKAEGISTIYRYMISYQPEAVEKYLETKGISSRTNQSMLAELIDRYNSVTFTAQNKWCQLIEKTDGLQPRLYCIAAKHYMRTGEYDKANELLDLAEKNITDENREYDTDRVENCRIDLDYYRENPYWPNLRALKMQLAEIYDQKGIAHPSLVVEGKRALSEEKFDELKQKIDSVDYSNDADHKYRVFVSPLGFNIMGLGDKSIDLLVDNEIINGYADIFRLKEKREEILSKKIFTEKKLDSILQSIENAREIADDKFLYTLHIPDLGGDDARFLLAEKSIYELLQIGEKHREYNVLANIKGVGEQLSTVFCLWFENEENLQNLHELLKEIKIVEKTKEEKGNRCEGLTVVITGKIFQFKNRAAIEDYIRSQGGQTSDSINAKTSFLINNDLESKSSKNKKAHQLNVPIISEDEFVEKYGKGE